MGRLVKWPVQLAILVTALILVDSLTYTSPAFADQSFPASNVSLKQVGLSDLTVYGYLPTLDLWFPGHGDYELNEGNYIQLEYDHSELVHPDDSTVTVLLNDIPLSTMFLTKDNARRTSWRINLPRDKLRRDMNRVQLKYYMHVSHGDCEPENPSLYSTVYAESYIHYEYTSPLRFINLPQPDLARFPDPFLRPTVSTAEVTFVLPDDASSTDFSAAASIAARFGQLAGSKPFKASLAFAGEFHQSLPAGSNLVVIGRPGKNVFLNRLSTFLPLQLLDVDGEAPFIDKSGSSIDPESGVVQEIVSPWDSRFSVLVVSGGSDEGLRRAVRTISSRLGVKPLQGKYAIVTKASEELSRAENSNDRGSIININLHQLQFDDVVVRGLGSHTVGFSFDMPPPDGGAYFDLMMSYSQVLDPERSTIMVSLNGVPVRSLLLKEEGNEKSRHRIRLPTSSLRPGVNSLAVTFNLYARYAWECGALAPERAWGVLHSDSTLVLTVNSERPSLDLANLPYPFVRDGVPSSTYLVLPDDPAVLRDSLQVAVALGRQSLGGTTELQAGLATQFTEEDKRRHDIVVYGLPANNSFLADIGQKLPLSLETAEKRSLQRSELSLLGVSDAAKLGIIELVPSLWNSEKGLLVVSGTSLEASRWSQKALEGRLEPGNAAIISDDGKLVGISMPRDAEKRTTNALLQSRPYVLASVPLSISIVGLLGLMLVRVGRQRK